MVGINGKEVSLYFKASTLGQLRESPEYSSFKDIFSGEKTKADKGRSNNIMAFLAKIDILLDLSRGLCIDDLAALDGDQLGQLIDILLDLSRGLCIDGDQLKEVYEVFKEVSES